MAHKKILVVLTGAGISAESGLNTFRDSNGLWEGYNVEDVATPRAFIKNPELVLRFYNERRANVRAAKPNAAHFSLAALEDYFDVRIITQNIDDLHERAGSSKVLHLHGEIFKMRSSKKPHDDAHAVRIDADIKLGDLAPDGGQYRPHIVWFEEQVPAIMKAAEIVSQADAFAVVGTSLVVYPAAGLVDLVPAGVPMYVVDKRLPPISGAKQVVTIEMPATEGVAELVSRLIRELEPKS